MTKMLDLKSEPFNGYVYLYQLGNGVPDTPSNKEFILSCNYAIRLLKEIDKNINALFEGIDKILREKPHVQNEIYEECFWLSDRIIDILKKLINLFNRFTKRTNVSDLITDAALNDKIKIIRDHQTHLEEKLLKDELTSYFRLSYSGPGCTIEMKLDNQLPYYSMNIPNNDCNHTFNPLNLTYKILNTLDRKNIIATGEIEVNFFSIKTSVENMYHFLKENMQTYVSAYNICCPAPTQLSIIMT